MPVQGYVLLLDKEPLSLQLVGFTVVSMVTQEQPSRRPKEHDGASRHTGKQIVSSGDMRDHPLGITGERIVVAGSRDGPGRGPRWSIPRCPESTGAPLGVCEGFGGP